MRCIWGGSEFANQASQARVPLDEMKRVKLEAWIGR